MNLDPISFEIFARNVNEHFLSLRTHHCTVKNGLLQELYYLLDDAGYQLTQVIG